LGTYSLQEGKFQKEKKRSSVTELAITWSSFHSRLGIEDAKKSKGVTLIHITPPGIRKPVKEYPLLIPNANGANSRIQSTQV
jgi:hypothetical protein